MSLFSHYPDKPRADECQSAYLILCNAHDAASSFLEIFGDVRRARKAHGTPTDEEQDLLRAVLVFASAGLDSMVKQLVRDALDAVVHRDEGASAMFKQFIERRLGRGEALDKKFVAEVLADLEPRDRLIAELVADATSRSLQSTDQILRSAALFDIPSDDLVVNQRALSEIFTMRNQIVHEMDVDFDQPNRNRRSRRKQHIIDATNVVFDLSEKFLSGVDKKLR